MGTMMKERGNILFLILLAIVLFVALSYAVTGSTQGGSKNASQEKMSLYASQIIGDVARWRTAIQRLKMVDNYKQVLFNTSVGNDSGTCYLGRTATTPCRTIGLFSAGTAINVPVVNMDFYTPAWQGNANKWSWSTSRVKVNGIDIGTSLPDTVIALNGITDELCKAFNQSLNNSNTIGTLYLANTEPQGRAYNWYNGNTFSAIPLDNYFYDGNFSDGCMVAAGTNQVQFIIEEN